MARGRRPVQDNTTLQMALVGYELEKQKIEAKIREIQSALGINEAPAAATTKRKRRKLSAAARRRIAVAQKKRWAEHRKKMAAGKGA